MIAKNWAVYYVSWGEVNYLKKEKPYHTFTTTKQEAKRFTEKQAHAIYRDAIKNSPGAAWGFGYIA